MPPPVVFDLDGTLVDSAAAIHAAVNRLLAREGTEALTLDTVRGFIGDGVPTLIERVMRATRRPEDTAERDRLAALFMADYGADPLALTVPMPGAPEALATLAAAGCRIGLCSNKPEAPSRAILEAFGLLGCFAVVVGGDSLPQRKPDPAPLRLAFERLGGPGLYVGDGEVDAATARAAGLPLLLYTGGYRRASVAELAPAAAFDRWADLPAMVLDGARWAS